MPFSVHLSLKKNSSRLANQSGALLMAEGEYWLLAQLGLGQHFSGLLSGGGVYVEVLEETLGLPADGAPHLASYLALRCLAKISQDCIRESESYLYSREILDNWFRVVAWAGMTTLLWRARTERILRPLTFLAVTSFAVPEKSLNDMEGFAIIIFLWVAASDSDTKIQYLLYIFKYNKLLYGI